MADEAKSGVEADSPKPHGDKLKVGTEPPIAKGEAAPSGDSPKHQGDKLEGAVKQAAKS